MPVQIYGGGGGSSSTTYALYYVLASESLSVAVGRMVIMFWHSITDGYLKIDGIATTGGEG